MRRICMLLIVSAIAAFGPTSADAQTPHITTYGEMYEEADGRILGDASSVTAYGEESGKLVVAEVDGYFRVLDEATGQLSYHGIINADGSVAKQGPSTPVKRPGGRIGRTGRIGGTCYLLEEMAATRCQLRCPYGIKKVDYGTCGFGGSCECLAPPPPPPEPTKQPGTYIAPWYTIKNYSWDGLDDRCTWQVCDGRDPL